MQSLVVVAGNTFKETVRDKILYNLVFFAILLIGASVLLGTLTIGEQSRIINDLGLASINLVAVIIAIFVGIGLVTKEIERRTIYTILARPITRVQFILGKYLGLTFIVVVNVAIMFAMFLGTIVVSGNVIYASLFQAVELILVETLLVMAIAMFFSTFSSSILSATMTIGVYIIGHLTSDLKGIAEKSQSQPCDALIKRVALTARGILMELNPTVIQSFSTFARDPGSHRIRPRARSLANRASNLCFHVCSPRARFCPASRIRSVAR